MSAIGILLVVLGVLGLLIYVVGCLAFSQTNDTCSLRRYAYGYLFSWVARKRLGDIYERQLKECSTAEDAMEIRNLVQHLPSDLYDRAYQKWEKLLIAETKAEIENARGDEERLLEILWEVACSPKPTRSLRPLVVDTLAPFTKEHICGAVTTEGLIKLAGGALHLGCFLAYRSELSRINQELAELYVNKLKELVLKDALDASKREDVSRCCFYVDTGNHVINALVAIKRNFLCFSPQINSFWTSGPLHLEIDFALRVFLDNHSTGAGVEIDPK